MNRGSNDARDPQGAGDERAPKPRGTFQEGSRISRGEGNRIASRPSASNQRRSTPRVASENPYLSQPTSKRASRTASKVRGSHVYQGDDRARVGSPQLSQPVITNRAQGYQTRAPHQRPYKRRSRVPIVVGSVIGVVAVVVLGVWLWWSNTLVTVTVNGTEAEVKRNTSIEQLVEAGYATPTPGDLLAIDGSILQEGEGDAFEATVDGTKVGPAYGVADGNVVEISDGGDVTEDTTTEQVAIPYDTVYDSDNPYAAAIHVYSDGQDGVMERVTGSISGITQENVVKEPVSAGYIEYNADTGDDKVVALTFDDGPWPETSDAILDVLKENDAKATFFTIGEQIPEYGEATKRAAQEGHQICTHSYDHASGSGQGVNLTFMTPEEQVQEIQKGYAAIEEATGAEASTVIRAPGGNFYGDLVKNLQPYITADIGWNIDTEDWRRPGVDAIVAQIESAQPGDIILMHDGGGDRSQTVEALSIALPYLREQGYRFVTIDELLQYPIPVGVDDVE